MENKDNTKDMCILNFYLSNSLYDVPIAASIKDALGRFKPIWIKNKLIRHLYLFQFFRWKNLCNKIHEDTELIFLIHNVTNMLGLFNLYPFNHL